MTASIYDEAATFISENEPTVEKPRSVYDDAANFISSVQEPEKKDSLYTQTSDVAKSGFRGLYDSAASVAQGVGYLGTLKDDFTESLGFGRDTAGIEQSGSYQAGTRLKEFAQEHLPDSGVQRGTVGGFLTRDVPQQVGGLVPFLLTGGSTKAIAGLGALQGAGNAVEQAQQAGLSPEDTRDYALIMGAVGSTMAFPLSERIVRSSPAVQELIGNTILRNAAVQSVEQGGQAFGQAFTARVALEHKQNPEVPLGQIATHVAMDPEMTKAAIAGGLIGGALGGLHGVVEAPSGKRKEVIDHLTKDPFIEVYDSVKDWVNKTDDEGNQPNLKTAEELAVKPKLSRREFENATGTKYVPPEGRDRFHKALKEVLQERESETPTGTEGGDSIDDGEADLTAGETPTPNDAPPAAPLTEAPTEPPAGSFHIIGENENAQTRSTPEEKPPVSETPTDEAQRAAVRTRAEEGQLGTEQVGVRPEEKVAEVVPIESLAPQQVRDEAAAAGIPNARTGPIETVKRDVETARADAEAPVQKDGEPLKTGRLGDPELIAANQLDMRAFRKARELAEIPAAEEKGFAQNLNDAVRQGIPDRANNIAQEIIGNPRSLTVEESAGMLYKVAKNVQELRGIVEQVKGGKVKDADMESLLARESDLKAENDAVSQAIILSGSERGRNLNSQKLGLTSDFEPVMVVARAEVNYRKSHNGESMPADMKAKFEKLASELKAKTEELDALRADKKGNEAVEEFSRIKKKAGKRSKETLDAELDSLTKEADDLIRAGCLIP